MPKLPEPLIYFIDDCLGSRELSKTLRQAGYQIRTLLEETKDPNGIIKDRSAADDHWIPLVSAQGWVILTSDKRARSLFREVILHARAACFFFTGNHVTGAKQAEIILKAIPHIENRCRKFSRPIIGKITPAGKVELDDFCQRSGAIKRLPPQEESSGVIGSEEGR